MTRDDQIARRPIKVRSASWVSAVTRTLVKFGARPNHISVLSVVFAALAASAMFYANQQGDALQAPLYVLAAICIPLRLLCNLFDGLLAVEGGLGTSTGDIYNEFPDRISDVIILVAAGYSAGDIQWSSELGWLAAIMALLIADIRFLGASIGTQHYFCGPMAKPHRMSLLTVALLLTACETLWDGNGQIIFAALAIIILGGFITIIRRLLQISVELRKV